MNSLKKLRTLHETAHGLGFDWPNAGMIIDQVTSEAEEVRQALQQNEGVERVQEEIGDLLHAVVSLCEFEGIDVEKALLGAAEKFEGRLETLARIAQQRGYLSLQGQSVEVLLNLWKEAKQLAPVKEQKIQKWG